MEAKYCVCLVLFSLLVLFLLMSNGNKETFSSDNGLFCRKDPKICAEEVSCNDVTINEQNKPLGNSVIFVKTVYLDSKPTSKSSWLEIFGSDIFDDFFEGFGGSRGRRRRRASDFRGADLRYDSAQFSPRVMIRLARKNAAEKLQSSRSLINSVSSSLTSSSVTTVGTSECSSTES